MFRWETVIGVAFGLFFYPLSGDFFSRNQTAVFLNTSASLSISFKIQWKPTFNSDVGDKSLLFWKPTFRCKKKKPVRKNTPENQKELNGIEAIYIAVVVVLIFTLSFLIKLCFILLFFFLPLTFSGTHVHTVGTGSYTPGNIA